MVIQSCQPLPLINIYPLAILNLLSVWTLMYPLLPQPLNTPSSDPWSTCHVKEIINHHANQLLCLRYFSSFCDMKLLNSYPNKQFCSTTQLLKYSFTHGFPWKEWLHHYKWLCLVQLHSCFPLNTVPLAFFQRRNDFILINYYGTPLSTICSWQDWQNLVLRTISPDTCQFPQKM